MLEYIISNVEYENRYHDILKYVSADLSKVYLKNK